MPHIKNGDHQLERDCGSDINLDTYQLAEFWTNVRGLLKPVLMWSLFREGNV